MIQSFHHGQLDPLILASPIHRHRLQAPEWNVNILNWMRAHLKSADYLMSITISSISTDIGGMFRELWANWAFETSFFYIFLQEVIMNRKSCNLIFSKAQRPKGYPLLPVSADQNKMILAKLVTFDTLFYCSRFSFSPSYITNLPFNFTPPKKTISTTELQFNEVTVTHIISRVSRRSLISPWTRVALK